MTVLRGPRLTLRPIDDDDFPALTALRADSEVGRDHDDDLAGSGPTGPDLAGFGLTRPDLTGSGLTRPDLTGSGLIRPGLTRPDFGRPDLTRPGELTALGRGRPVHPGPTGTGDWVFELDGAVVGIGYLRTSLELPGGVLEAGCHLAREHRGNGLAGEAARAILGHAHHTLGAQAVFTLVHHADSRGRAFAERLGFLDVGVGDHYGAAHRVMVNLRPPGGVHHVELWVADLAGAERSIGWLLTRLGWREYQRWPRGVSWRYGTSYVVVEDSPDRCGDLHDRTRVGLNHLALHVPSRAELDRVTAAAPEHGWRLLFADRHPHAGGPDHYATYLENDAGFEVELVAAEHAL